MAKVSIFELGTSMINTEAGNILVEYSQHIARWAKIGDKSYDDETAVSYRAHENAWRLLSALLQFGERVKESDMYWKLAAMAVNDGKSAREQHRLFTIAKLEDREYMKAKSELEKMLAEMLAEEKADPTNAEDWAKVLEARAYRAGASERAREERNRKARERRQNTKTAAAAEAVAVVKKAKAPATRKVVKKATAKA